MDEKCVIYGLYCVCPKCEDTPERVRYVGQTRRTLGERLRAHTYPSSCRGDYALARWKLHHGLDNIRALVLEKVESPEELDSREIFWVRKLKTKTTDHQGGLNSTAGGTGPRPEKHTKPRAKGELAPNAKLTWVTVNSMRGEYAQGRRVEEMAAQHAISYSHARNIVRNITWIDPEYTYVKRPLMSGENRSSSKISRETALQIEADLKKDTKRGSQARIAVKYGVSRGIVGRIARNERRDLIE